MPTVGETIAKISELRSRWAILHEVLVYLETHYKSSDAGPPEIKIHTNENTIVPEEHIDIEVSNITHQMDQISQELDEWEKLVVMSPGEEPKPPRKRKPRGAKSQHQNQTPAGNRGQKSG